MWPAEVFSIGVTLVDVLQNWLSWFHSLFLEVGLLVILINFIIPRCYKDVYVNSPFPRTARLWNSLPVECFYLTYDLSGIKSRINKHLNCRFFLNIFPVCSSLFVLLFFVTPCRVVAVQPCME